MMRIFCKQILDVVERVVNNCVDKLVPDDRVASEDKKSIGNVGNGFDNVQHDSKLNKMTHQILGIEWGDDGVPGEIGTFPANSKCLTSWFLVQK